MRLLKSFATAGGGDGIDEDVERGIEEEEEDIGSRGDT
jgi:hypothetical protein